MPEWNDRRWKDSSIPLCHLKDAAICDLLRQAYLNDIGAYIGIYRVTVSLTRLIHQLIILRSPRRCLNRMLWHLLTVQFSTWQHTCFHRSTCSLYILILCTDRLPLPLPLPLSRSALSYIRIQCWRCRSRNTPQARWDTVLRHHLEHLHQSNTLMEN